MPLIPEGVVVRYGIKNAVVFTELIKQRSDATHIGGAESPALPRKGSLIIPMAEARGEKNFIGDVP